jgi:hypothetical protein
MVEECPYITILQRFLECAPGYLFLETTQIFRPFSKTGCIPLKTLFSSLITCSLNTKTPLDCLNPNGVFERL